MVIGKYSLYHVSSRLVNNHCNISVFTTKPLGRVWTNVVLILPVILETVREGLLIESSISASLVGCAGPQGSCRSMLDKSNCVQS